ncbi:hypothetical protein [Oenococcus oeni]|uniref:hypothetical protein n=2 Tax=Oenococcus oeni TaxID=1247 RepID=UPI000B27465F|nr:hypothetical protein [Oenococcus oeni]UCU87403.1 hypothetical protein J3U91_01596 [Oenococcus oeni]
MTDRSQVAYLFLIKRGLIKHVIFSCRIFSWTYLGNLPITFHYVRGSAFEKIITETILLEEVVSFGSNFLISDKKQAKILAKIPQN